MCGRERVAEEKKKQAQAHPQIHTPHIPTMRLSLVTNTALLFLCCRSSLFMVPQFPYFRPFCSHGLIQQKTLYQKPVLIGKDGPHGMRYMHRMGHIRKDFYPYLKGFLYLFISSILSFFKMETKGTLVPPSLLTPMQIISELTEYQRTWQYPFSKFDSLPTELSCGLQEKAVVL